MLAGLRFRYADQETDTPPVAVFNAEQVEILGEALATGLGRATPSQDVTFSIIGAHRLSPGAFARRNRLTAGRVFFREGELNVIFGEIQSPYRKKNVYGQVDQDFYPREFGSRTIPSEQESILIASTAASLRGDPQGQRDDWVVFDPDAGAMPAPSPVSMDSTTEDWPTDEPEPEPTQMQPAPASTDAAPVASSGAAATGDIEQRLDALKRLREKDLISEEAYRQKVDEILEEL